MPRTNFILGVALLVVAATLAITITIRPLGEPAQTGARSVPGDRAGHFAQSNASRVDLPTRTPRTTGSDQPLVVRAPDSHPERERLATEAVAAEREATRSLDRFTDRLQLSAEQRRLLFPILVRSSGHYDPAMLIAGGADGAPALDESEEDRELNKVLDPNQRDQFIEDSLNDLALWEEMVKDLARRLGQETPEVPTVDGQPAPETPSSTGSRQNLFELLDPSE